jgi:hypothetical protein
VASELWLSHRYATDGLGCAAHPVAPSLPPT